MTEHTTSTSSTEQIPVNHVRLSDSQRQFIIEECVLCGERHAHGSKDAAVANGGRSRRVAHCRTGCQPREYYLELHPNADPPATWYEWVDRTTGVEIEIDYEEGLPEWGGAL